MHIRTFQAPTLQEALAEIRRQMGSDATVLHTRDVHRGMFGWFGKSHVEVTAGLKPKTAIDQPNHAPATGSASATAPARKPSTAVQTTVSGAEKNKHTAEVQQLSQQLERLTQVVQSLEQRQSQPASSEQSAVPRDNNDAQASIIETLVQTGIAEVDARWIAQRINFRQPVAATERLIAIRASLRSQFRLAGPIQVPHDQQRVVALVGPTGVGKTTTVAKLAAGFRLSEKRSVGLITIDTYRIAAVDQLHKYAQVMQLPMEVVSNAEQMRDAIAQLRDVDLILIDTIGRSPRDTDQLAVTRKLLQSAKPHETHLVLSATSSRSAIDSAVSNYSILRPDAVIISKLDEIQGQPDLLAFADAKVPAISYVTTGQNVPDDIDLPQPSRLVDLALGGTETVREEIADTTDSLARNQENADETNVKQQSSHRRRNLLLPPTA